MIKVIVNTENIFLISRPAKEPESVTDYKCFNEFADVHINYMAKLITRKAYETANLDLIYKHNCKKCKKCLFGPGGSA